MNYTASVSDFFKSPKWFMNMLLATVCLFIPAVGTIVIGGWLITGFFGRREADPSSGFPDFDFNLFVKYLERGVWPFLIQLVVMVVAFPVAYIVMLLAMFLMVGVTGTAAESDEALAATLGIVGMVVMIVVSVIAMLGFNLLIRPLHIRSAIAQDFPSAFNFAFMKRFIGLTWKEQIVATLFLIVASVVLSLAGTLVLCIGMYLAMPVIFFAMWHLDHQLYQLFLQRGGEPVPVSPKLMDSVGPPAIPR